MQNPTVRAAVYFGAILLLLIVAGRILSFSEGSATAASFSGGQVAKLTIEGAITASDPYEGFWGSAAEASSVAICRDLYDIAEDPAYDAVLLRVNSPGGSAAGSDEIYRAVQYVRAQDKPVVVSMGDMAASGGYYVSAPADFIYANGATLTGSIGVIFQLMKFEELAEKIGIDDVTLHAGKYKDIGSPWRDMSEEERAILTKLLKQVHEQFIAAVDEGRGNLSAEQVRALATGEIWTGEGALAVGLVDGVGGLREAEAKARELAELDDDAPVIDYAGGDFWSSFFGVRAPSHPAQAALERFAASPLQQFAAGLLLNSTLRDLRVR